MDSVYYVFILGTAPFVGGAESGNTASLLKNYGNLLENFTVLERMKPQYVKLFFANKANVTITRMGKGMVLPKNWTGSLIS